MYAVFRKKASTDGALAAGYIRAGFHDCITVNPDDPESGCNGSLQFEVGPEPAFGPNRRLGPTVDDMKTVGSDFPCISFADTILIAYAASSFVSRGGSIIGDLVSDKLIHTDVTKPDLLPDGSLDLPNGGDSSFTGQLAFYQRKNFNARDFIASLVVGHSIGGFARPGTTAPIFIFTETSPTTVNGDYCGALLAARQLNLGNVAPPNFNFLPSDFSITDSAEGLGIVNTFCGIELGDNNEVLGFTENIKNIQNAFREFSKKMALL